MSRLPVFPVEDKIRIVLSVLAGELTIAEAAPTVFVESAPARSM